MFGKRLTGEMQKIARAVRRAVPLHPYAFVDIIADPFGFGAVVEPDFSIRIPAAVTDPAAEYWARRGNE